MAGQTLGNREATDLTHLDLGKCFSNLESNRTVRERILTRLRSQSGGRNVSVTDLLNLRQAYWRRVRPDVKIDLDRSADMLAGSGFHDAFNWKVSSEAWIEQKVTYQDIGGRIDIYEDRPLELKTTKSIIEAEELRRLRPTYLEQLGMYCAMVEKTDGWLLMYNRGEGRPLVGASVHFDLVKSIQREMLRRRDALRGALDIRDPSTLPTCMWSGKGCAFEGICDCTPGPVGFSIADLAHVEPSAYLEQEFGNRFQEAPSPQPEGVSINDLVYPRQTFFESLQSEEEEDDLSEGLTALDNRAFTRELKYRGLGGVAGEYTSRPVQLGKIRGRVEFHEGRVLWVTRCGFRDPVARYRLVSALGDRLLRLGFNAVLANVGRSRMVVWYPNVPDEDARVIVYDLTWDNLSALRTEMIEREKLLDAAKSSGDFSNLAKCPAWRAKFCEFAPGCGCGTDDS